MSEGHMTPNDDISVRLKFRYCLVVSQFTVSPLIRCILADEIDFEIDHFRNFRTSATVPLDDPLWRPGSDSAGGKPGDPRGV